MSVENRFKPPQDWGVEIETLGFDFGLILGPNETITSAAIICVPDVGVDAAASTRLVGVPFIVSSTKTGAVSAQVNQRFGQVLPGVTYKLQCIAQSSDAPNEYSIVSYISGTVAP